MSENTKIEWCDSTFNPWIGCTKVSPACDDCYAARSTPARAMGIVWGPKEARHRTAPGTWSQPKRWEREHAAFYAEHGRRRRVFCASLADVFDNAVPEAWRADLFEVIAKTPRLDWLLLTKRIGNVTPMIERLKPDLMLREVGAIWPLPNVWLGISVVNQEEADRDIPKLLATPARVRWLSMEPLLGPVDASPWLTAAPIEPNGGGTLTRRVDWVIAGGESGPEARPMHPDWPRSLRDQCTAAGVPFLFKQWGEWTPGENVERVRGIVDTAFLDDIGEIKWRIYPLNLTTDNGHIDDQPDLYRVGKKAAGRWLDGVQHDGFPEAT